MQRAGSLQTLPRIKDIQEFQPGSTIWCLRHLPDCIKICDMEKKYITEGVCLNGGSSRVCFNPAENFLFYMHNNRGSISIPLDYRNLSVENHTITFGKEKRVRVVEHLFSTLYGLNIFNIRIDLYGDELPFFDGSSRDFVKLLRDFPGQKAAVFKIRKNIVVQDNDSFILFEPGDAQLFIDMELNHPYIGIQKIFLEITTENYIKEISPARTFVFTDESDPRIKKLPPYGIGITPEKIYSSEPLRFPDEPVRHKVLDLLGDLYVLRKKLYGRIRAKNISHKLNLEFVRQIASIAE
uniref:UDP-3-O-acyl-N-acetylglucosamine deacetylase n=1 Tax=candidate division WOR-3 bacterium TaxID=2052148 RepID=A0A7C6AFZ3_UNCW3